jgi:acetyl-CoA acetyltransferase
VSPTPRAIVAGVGQSEIGRRLRRPALDLTLEAVFAALADAGLNRTDIDGLACWPGYASSPGFSPVSVTDIKEALRLELNWYTAGSEASQMSAIINACMAVISGQARHVLCFRTMTESTAMAQGVRSSLVGGGTQRVTGSLSWLSPFDAPSASNWIALTASRYAHDFGLEREQLAQVALNARRNAGFNPKAVYRTPLTMDEYLNSRMISSPLCLYDCDVPIDGSTVVIVSQRETGRDLKGIPILIEAICGPLYGRDSWDQTEDHTRFAAEDAGKRLWSLTDLKPRDVDVAALYDGFSFLSLLWLEGLGFCGRGEAGAFVEGGHRIALDGELPLATGGGQLSAGRLHGLGHFAEAVLQLRGQGGDRQVPKDPRVAVVSNGGGPIASAALLVRE